MNTWFECKVKYQKIDESGREKNVREVFLVDAVSFTDSEARVHKNLEECISGEFSVTNISRSKLVDIFPFDDGDKWYKSKIEFISVDESSGKEKKTSNIILILANDLQEAVKRTDESLTTMIVPYDIKSVVESPIVDVFPYFQEEENNDEIPENLRPVNEYTEE